MDLKLENFSNFLKFRGCFYLSNDLALKLNISPFQIQLEG